MGLNKVQIIGHLGATPEMRYTAQGVPVTSFRVGVNGPKRRDGSETPTEWFRVSAWDKLAEICNQYLDTGTKVYVEGRLQTRQYTDRDGIERSAIEVIAQDMIILSSRGERAPAPVASDDDGIFPDEEPARPAPARPAPAAKPRTSAPNAPRPPARNVPQPIESDDDIPF
jgi:single-strand DNA-binding protein